MNKPLLILLILGGTALVTLPVGFYLKVASDAHAERMETDPAYRADVQMRVLVRELAAKSPGAISSDLEQKRVRSLVEQIAEKYEVPAPLVAQHAYDAREVLLQGGIQEGAIPMLESLNLAFAPRSKGNDGLLVKVATYVLLRKQGASQSDLHALVAPSAH